MGSNSVRANFSLTERVDTILDEKAAEWNMSRSEIVRKAVLEYTDQDRTKRIEDKLDRVLEEVSEGAPHTVSEDTPEKERASENDSDTSEDLPAEPLPADSSSPAENRADEMFNFLINEYSDTPLISEPEIREAIVEVWGNDSEHVMEKYPEKIKSRLVASGCEKHPTRDVWYFDRDVFLEQAESQWGDLEQVLVEGDIPDQWTHEFEDEVAAIEEGLTRANGMKQAVLDAGIESEDEVEEVIKQGQELLREQAGPSWKN